MVRKSPNAYFQNMIAKERWESWNYSKRIKKSENLMKRIRWK